MNGTDPSGKVGLFGGLVSVGLDVGISLLTGQEITAKSLAISFGSGFVGAGVAHKIATLAKVGVAGKTALNVGADTVQSIATTVAQDGGSFENVSATGVLTDVLVGQAGGEVGARILKDHLPTNVNVPKPERRSGGRNPNKRKQKQMKK